MKQRRLNIRRPKRKVLIVGFVLMLVVVGACGFFFRDKTLADIAPVESVTTSGKKIFYSIAHSSFTQATETRLAVYYDNRPSPNADINIIGPDDGDFHCSGALRVNINIGSSVVRNNILACSSAYTNLKAGSSATYDQGTGKYKLDIRITRRSGDGYFRFRVDAPGGSVRSVGGGVMSYETAYSRGTASYGNYSLGFGADCNIPQNGSARRAIVIKDPDNYPADTSSAQRGKSFYVYVEEAARASSSYTRVNISRYGDLINTARSSNNRLLPSVDKENASFTFDMRGNYKYRLVFEDLDHNNTIQVTLPTDEIYNDIPCRWWRDASQSAVAVNPSSPGRWDNYASRRTVTRSGQQVYFAHRVQNLAPGQSSTLETWSQRFWTADPANHSNTTTVPPSGWSPAPTRLSNAALTWSNYFYYLPARNSPYTVTANDLNSRSGQYLCERVATRPVNHTSTGAGEGWKFSGSACAYIAKSYSVTPTVSLSSDSIEEASTSFGTVNARLINSGPAATDPSIYFLSRFVIKKGESLPMYPGNVRSVPFGSGSNLVSNWGCYIAQTYMNGVSCREIVVNGRPQPIPFNSGGQVVFNGMDDNLPPSLEVGDRVCYILGLTRYSRRPEDNSPKPENEFHYNTPVCANVSKKPKTQFHGADVRSSRDVRTSISPIRRAGEPAVRYYGSWAEYALFSGGVASSSSGGGLSSDRNGRDFSGQPLAYNRITFANTGTVFGNYETSSSRLPAAFTSGGSSLSNSSVNVGDLATGTYVRSGDLTLTSADLQLGKQIIIRATGTVTISGNIRYASGPYSESGNLPQLVVVARNIVINQDVENIDAWLVARASGSGGYLSTCGAVSGGWLNGLRADTCNKPLKINGPVMADRLYLRRTFGAEKENPGLPAEVLNLRPDTYISFYKKYRNTGAIKTQYVRELPPRF